MSEDESTEYPEGPVKVNDNDFQETINEYPLVLVDFWAEWCGPCKMMEPVLEELAEEYQGEVVIAKMNVDKNQKVPSQFQVSSIPTLVLFKDGERVDRMIGALQKQQLEQKFEEHMN
ncbi:MAG: thioredoxin [Candidatus Thermoplasmatota archaeon]|nr:thioredoxin [Candidatus Thermoplasmatota archaeon]